MSELSQSNFLQALGWAVINSLWQMALLWVCFQVIVSFSAKLNAGRRAGLATIFLFAGFAWFIYTFLVSYFANPQSNYLSFIQRTVFRDESWKSRLMGILPAASLVYLFLLIIPVWNYIRNYRYVQLIRKTGLSKIDIDWRIFVNKVAARIGIKRKVQLWLSNLIDSPVTVGFLKPIILLPVASINNLSTRQVEAVILHELSHIRRFDYFINLLVNFIKTVLYFNPFVKFFADSIEKEREKSCDDIVMQFQYEPREYASALLLLEKTGIARSQQMMMAAAGTKNNLLQRIENILGIQRKIFPLKRMAGSLLMLASVIMMNTMLFISNPPDGKLYFGMNSTYNPYYFINTGKEDPLVEMEINPDNTSIVPIGTIASGSEEEVPVKMKQQGPTYDYNYSVADVPAPGFMHVNFTQPVIPELSKEAEETLKTTLLATKKVLEEKEWREVEKAYADILNSSEKNKVKQEYKKELENVDWKKMEDQLRLSYDKINWNRINTELAISLEEIRLDSLQHVVTSVICDLDKIECWMKENKSTAVPDTDITLHKIRREQEKAKAELSRIKSVRTKKIVRL